MIHHSLRRRQPLGARAWVCTEIGQQRLSVAEPFACFLFFGFMVETATVAFFVKGWRAYQSRQDLTSQSLEAPLAS
jgi:hypothetical protein